MPKNIVICCDGTDNEVATDSTNVLRLYRMLTRNEKQIAYYDSGIGTLVEPSAITKFRKRISRTIDAMIGHRVRENAITSYRFLARHYQPGDQIYLFGFSRGAYTVRVVAGMIRMLGLLRPELEHLANLGWTIYANEIDSYIAKKRFSGSNRFNTSFGLDQKPLIHLVGVWDTVSAFGSFWSPKMLPYTRNNELIVHFRHAMAIDERRVSFQANMFNPNPKQELNSKAVWFAGVHSDVGGGYAEKENNATLAKVSLEWMIREAHEKGLVVDAEKHDYLMNSEGKPPADPLGTVHDSLKGILWRTMEYLLWRQWDHQANRMKWRSPHCGARRNIVEGATIHRSVITRKESNGYWPLNLPKEYSIEE